MVIDMENFIAVKGIKALGNVLTSDKVKQISLLDPLPYEEPEPEPEEVIQPAVDDIQDGDIPPPDDDGQIPLF
jgi:topoisomerase-4 subunit A